MYIKYIYTHNIYKHLHPICSMNQLECKTKSSISPVPFLCFLCALSINLAKFNSLIIRTAGISNPSPLANGCSLIKQKPVRDGLI